MSNIKYTITNSESLIKLEEIIKGFSEQFREQITHIEEGGFKICKIHIGNQFSNNE